MNEITIHCNLNSPQNVNTSICIEAENNVQEVLLYKFMIGCNGTWKTIKDFETNNSVQWIPEAEGKYIIMVQAKEEKSKKPFQYVTRVDFIIGNIEEKLIDSINLNNDTFKIGDKLILEVTANYSPLMFRYWLRQNENWQLIKEYSPDNILSWTIKSSGEQEILAECKRVESKNNFDDFKSVKFQVSEIKSLEIKDFKCLSDDLLVDSEIIFQVDASADDSRTTLYKFVKLNSKGKALCVQDYSTKKIVSFIEKESGTYRLLCLAKDMYSQREYDDRAIINYEIKPYNKIEIQSFTSDLNSPQINGSEIVLKAVVKGGKELLYRYIIDGNYGEDSGYIRNNTYMWKANHYGTYNVSLLVKDKQFQGLSEDESNFEFTIDEKSDEPVIIKNVTIDRNITRLLTNSTVKITADAEGGTKLKYSFIVKKDGKDIEKIQYGDCNWVNFTPEQSGNYELEVWVKDKYSEREYDSHSTIYFEIFDYLPANIDYVLKPSKEYYVCGDGVCLLIICENTSSILVKYILKINGHKVEESDFVKNMRYSFVPKVPGIYAVEIFAKNIKCNKEFDCKREVAITVNDAIPITNCTLKIDKAKIQINEGITLTAECDGGKNVLYEFYVMEKDDWILVQKYSEKNYYTFIPFSNGIYKVLSLVKSSNKRTSYEDYAIMEFMVK
ncbi:MAG: Two component regulator three protein [Clostridiaceae bacterium]|nr:Two component regulator three protein [Clostridiaceae bacterium]